MTFTTEAIDRRIVAYRCCMGNAVHRHLFYKARGKMDRSQMYWDRALLLDWAIDVLCGYQREGMECNTQRASTYDEVCCAIKLADPCCVVSECVPAPPPPQPGAPTCVITPVYTVLRVVDVNERLVIESLGPVVGDSYLVALDSGGSGWAVNTIQTWNGSGWDAVTLLNGQVVLDNETSQFWVTRSFDLPGLLFPPIEGYLVAAISQYVLQSSYPQTAYGSSRLVTLRAFMGGAWVVIYEGAESAFADPFVYNFAGLAIEALEVVYTEANGCTYTAGATVVPPFGECGTVTVAITAQQVCGANEFMIDVNIISIEGYPLGNIIPYVDGVEQAGIPGAVGVTTFGPYQDGQEVYFRIVNAQDSECDFVSSPVTGNWNPAYSILGSGDLNDIVYTWNDGQYLIVSDNSNLIGTEPAFADLNIGDIVDVDGVYVATPSPGDIIFLSNGGGAYWVVGSTPGEIELALPPVELVFNELISQWTAVLPYLPPASVGGGDVPVVVTGVCFGTPFTIYSGPASGLEDPLVFSPPCGHGSLSGSISYQVGDCSFDLDAVITLNNGDLTGDPDPDFYGGLNNYVQDLRIQADGKILVGGNFTAHGIVPAGRFTRLNPDGTLDTDYNTNQGTGLNGPVLGVEYDYAGRAYVCGFFTSHNGVSHGHIIRFNPDGTVDTSFNTGTGFSGSFAQDMAITSTGQIIVGGLFTSYNGTPVNNIVALNEDGSIYTDFAIGTGMNGFVQEVIVDQLDRILVGGAFTDYNGNFVPQIVRLNIDGSIDTSFNPGSGFDNWNPNDLGVLPDQRIIAVGKFTSFNGTAVPNIVALNDDGSIDTAFMANIGVGFGQTFQDVCVLPNGEMFISGPMFGEPGGVASNRIVQLNGDGTRHVMFDVGLGPNERVADVQLDPTNGTIIAGGFFTVYDGVGRLRIVRIT